MRYFRKIDVTRFVYPREKRLEAGMDKVEIAYLEQIDIEIGMNYIGTYGASTTVGTFYPTRLYRQLSKHLERYRRHFKTNGY